MTQFPPPPRRPALSYILASYERDGFATVPEDLALLSSLGFRTVTLLPTFYVRGARPDSLQIDFGQTPDFVTLQELFARALALGFRLRVTPHLDAADGTWRAYVPLDPLQPLFPDGRSYCEAILLLLTDALAGALASSAPSTLPPDGPAAVLTLGSELESSLAGWPESWMGALEAMEARLRDLGCRELVHLAHNVNWDHEVKFERRYLREAVKRGAPPALTSLRRQQRDAYLAALDRVSVSFYPPVSALLARRMERVAWGDPAGAEVAEAVAGDRLENYARYAGWLFPLARRIDLGEVGLGSGDARAPAAYDEQAFAGPAGQSARNVRLHYWSGLFRMAERIAASGLPAFETMTTWSVGSYNVLGTAGQPDRADSIIAGMMRAYNAWSDTGFPA